MMLLVDSSVWIPFLRGHGALPDRVSQAMSDGKAHLCPVVWVEIQQGVRGKREERIVTELAELCPSLPIDDPCWHKAARLGRAASLAGLNCPLADVLIVACALCHGADLCHADKHMTALLKL